MTHKSNRINTILANDAAAEFVKLLAEGEGIMFLREQIVKADF